MGTTYGLRHIPCQSWPDVTYCHDVIETRFTTVCCVVGLWAYCSGLIMNPQGNAVLTDLLNIHAKIIYSIETIIWPTGCITCAGQQNVTCVTAFSHDMLLAGIVSLFSTWTICGTPGQLHLLSTPSQWCPLVPKQVGRSKYVTNS